MNGPFAKDELREIGGRARTLAERLDGPTNGGGSPPIDPGVILDQWRDQFPDDESFRARLARDNLTETTVRELIAATRWPEAEPLPDWTGAVSDLVQHVQTSTAADRGSVETPDRTPFRPLLEAIASYACERLSEDDVPTSATSPMEAHLVSRLESLCVRALYVEFKSFVEVHDPELAATKPDEVADPPTEYYERFTAAMFDGGFKNLCLEYPVLARQLVSLLSDWRGAVEELCQRVQRDRETLQRRFGVAGMVTDLEPLTDDAHAGGRVPVRVSFETGTVIYKPRAVDGEVALYAILDRLDEHLSSPRFETPTVLPSQEYGWMEYREYRDLPDEGAADRYYERAGTLLCLAYVINFTDCHYENLIADGDAPTIVDGETVFHPPIDPEVKPIDTMAAAVVDGTALLSALVPYSVGDPREPDDGRFAEKVNGLGTGSEERVLSNWSRPSIEAVNTDVMTVEIETVTVDASTNTPSLGDADTVPGDYVDAIVRGFEEAYETVRDLHERGRFLSEIATPELVLDVETRLIYRSTGAYGSVLQSAAARDPLRDGARLSLEYERLAVPFFTETIESDELWALYNAERRALLNRDVPRFASRTDRRTITHRGADLDVETDETAFAFVRRRLDAMDGDDRRRQTWLIRQGFDETTTAGGPPPAALDVSEEQFRSEAIDLFDSVVDATIDAGDERGWVSVVPESAVGLYPTDRSLYGGTGGIALTAIALYVATGRDRYRRFADETLAPIVDVATSADVPVEHGGLRGIGSIVYVLSVVGELLDENRYRAAARSAAETLTASDVGNAEAVDVVGGVAGTLLGLLAHHDRRGDATVLDRAVDCGDRLLDARTEVDGHRVWETTDRNVALTGFAHGSNGIGYALARLGAATGDAEYVDAAREALAFESAMYSPSRTNWARSAVDESYQDRWCHGRTGMALGRIGIAEATGDRALLVEARRALAETESSEPSHLDNVCCGNSGRVEAQLVGARRAGGDESVAGDLAARCLARRQCDGALSLPGHASEFVNPTFFDGCSGAAYTLLRLQHPDALPCVLLLE